MTEKERQSERESETGRQTYSRSEREGKKLELEGERVLSTCPLAGREGQFWLKLVVVEKHSFHGLFLSLCLGHSVQSLTGTVSQQPPVNSYIAIHSGRFRLSLLPFIQSSGVT